MPQHKSAKKRVRQNIKKKLANKSILTRYRSAISEFVKSIDLGDKKKSQELLSLANSAGSKAVSKGIIKRQAASRKISALSKMLN